MNVDLKQNSLFGEFLGILNYDELTPLIGRLNEKHFTKKDFPVTYKTLHVWTKEGLFPEAKPEERDWRRFSFVEYVWLSIIIKLKEFGLSTEKILLAKNVLVQPVPVLELVNLVEYMMKEGYKDLSKQEQKILQSAPDELKTWLKDLKKITAPDETAPQFSLLTFILANFIVTRANVHFLFDRWGKVFPWADNKEEYYAKSGFAYIKERDHISISLSNLVRQYISHEQTESETPRFQVLTEEEQEVVKYLREKKLSELTIRFDNNHKVSLIETTENLNSVDVEARYFDHILKNGYHDISYTTQGGKIVRFKRTTKKRFNSKTDS